MKTKKKLYCKRCGKKLTKCSYCNKPFKNGELICCAPNTPYYFGKASAKMILDGGEEHEHFHEIERRKLSCNEKRMLHMLLHSRVDGTSCVVDHPLKGGLESYDWTNF